MKKYKDQIKEMGTNELELFKRKVVDSQLDRKDKKELFDAIEAREKLINREDAMAVSCNEVSLD